MKWIVTQDLLVSARVEIEIEADTREDAIDAMCDALPHKTEIKGSGWKFDLAIKPPKGTVLGKVRPYFVEQASGGEKARKAKV